MNEYEQRTMASGDLVITKTSGSYAPPSSHEVYCIEPIGSCAVVAINRWDGVLGGTTMDTHLTTDGTSGGSAVTLVSPMVGSWTSVTTSAGTARLHVRLRAQ